MASLDDFMKGGDPVSATESSDSVSTGAQDLDSFMAGTPAPQPPSLDAFMQGEPATVAQTDNVPDPAEIEQATQTFELGIDMFRGARDFVNDFENLPQTAATRTFQAIDKFKLAGEMNNLEGFVDPSLEKIAGTETFAEMQEQAEIRRSEQADRIENLKTRIQAGEDIINELTPADMTFVGESMRSGVESALGNSPGLVASMWAKNPGPMLTQMAAVTYGHSAGDMVLADQTPDAATAKALIDSSIEVMTELLPAKFLVSEFGQKILDGAGDVSGPLLRFAIADMTGEQIATATQSLNDYAFGQDQEITEDMTMEQIAEIQGRRQLATAFATIAGGAVQTATVAGTAKLEKTLKEKFKKDPEADQELVGPTIHKERLAARAAAAEADLAFEQQVDETVRKSTVQPLVAMHIPASARKATDNINKRSMEIQYANEVIREDGKWVKFGTSPRAPGVYLVAPAQLKEEINATKELIDISETNANSLEQNALLLRSQGLEQDALTLVGRAAVHRERLVELREKVNQLHRRETTWMVDMQQAQGVLEEWRNTFLPNHKLLLGDIGKAGDTRNGYNISMLNGAFTGLNALKLNTSGKLYGTLAHEFGHAFANNDFQNLGPKAQKAILLEYEAFTAKQLNRTFPEAAINRQSPDQVKDALSGITAKSVLRRPLKDLAVGNPQLSGYWLNFDEYTAQQMAKYQTYDARARKVAEPFFKSLTKKLERFFKKERKHFSTEPTYQAWLDARAAGRELELVEGKLNQEILEQGPEGFTPAMVEAYQQETITQYSKDWAGSIGGGKTLLSTMMNRPQSPFGQKTADNLSGKLDNFSRFKKNFLTLLQIARRNPHIPGLAKPTERGEKSYLQLQREMASDRMASDKLLEDVLNGWRLLGSKQAEKVGQLLAEIDRISFQEKRRVSAEEVREKATELGLNEDAWQEYQNIKRHLENQVDMLQEQLEARVLRQVEEGDIQDQLLADIRNDMTQLRARNFFPSARFGNHVVVVRAKADGEFEGQKYRKGDVLIREHFEIRKDADSRTAELKASNIGRANTVFQDKIEETADQSFRDIPPAALKVLKQGANAEQQALIDEALVRAAPGQGFAKHLLKKRGITGASRDYMKSLLSYNHSITRHMARIKFDDQMNDAIGGVNQSIKEIQDAGGNATKRRLVMEYMQEHKDYIFNPGNEFNEWSSLSFFMYLAGVPKQAFLNVSQIPMVTNGYLLAKYGPKAELELAAAIKQVWDKKWNPTKLKPELREALLQGEQEGFLDQSFSHEAAGLQQSDTLRRMMPGNLAGSHKLALGASEISKAGAYLFHKSEIFTRRIAFVAGWNLEFKKSGDVMKAYQAARDTVQASVFEYAQWNRPRIMTGKKKPFFIFMTHVQHMLDYMFGKNPGKWYIWAMILFSSGLQGLPFAEDLLDAAEFFMRKFLPKGSNAVARNVLRDTVHDFAKTLDEDSAATITDVMLNGAGRHGFGLGWLGERAGVPLPEFDISGSLSLGDVIPGTQALNARTKEEAIATVTEGALGPGLGLPLAILGAMLDDSGDALKRATMVAPKALANPLKAVEYYKREKATTRSGVLLAEFDRENPLHKAEMISQALGFPVTRVNLNREMRWQQKQVLNFYSVQRSLLMDQFTRAIKADDAREAKADALAAIHEFNRNVPHPSLRIAGDTLKSSVIKRLKGAKLRDLNVPGRRADIPTSREVGELFKDKEGETTEILSKGR